VVQGTTSQTADLQQWQDSSGNKLAKIISNGSLVFGNGDTGAGFTSIHFDQVITSTNTPDGITWNFVTTNTKSAQILAVRTAASYATDLYFATANPADQNASEKMRISSTGTVTINGFTSSNVGLIVKGAASQTADLQQWQNSSGTVLAKVDAAGMLVVGNTAGTIQVTSSGTSGSYPSSGAGIELVAGSSSGTDLIQAYNRNTSSWRYLTIQSAGLLAKSVYTTNVPLSIQGTTSQSASLQQWQNSSGTVLSSFSSSGRLAINTSSDAGGRALYVVQPNGGYGAVFEGAGTVQNVSIYAASGGVGLVIAGATSQTANLQEWQNSSSTVLAKMDANGNFSAISKSFDIKHPTKENMRLRYASLEGPENGIYIRGTAVTNIIELPDYWIGLVHEDSITVSLTSVGSAQNIYVEKIEDNKVYIGGDLEKAFFTVYGERKDIDKLTVEY
jgi:hypothetical protein